MKGWHFLAGDGKLGYKDERLVEVGVPLAAEGDLELCENGMHASKRILDALRYAPGTIICRVELTGELRHADDKMVGRQREVLWMLTAAQSEDVLRRFARSCALDVVELWDAPEVVVQYLKTGAEDLRDAAWADMNKKQNRRLTALAVAARTDKIVSQKQW